MTIPNAAGDLIARLRAATVGNRILDCEIALFVGLPEDGMFGGLPPGPNGQHTETGAPIYGPPAYTTSLDAAASLMLPGWDWQMNSSNAQSEWRVLVWDYNSGFYAPIAVVGGRETAPLALCIAFMEARQ